MAGVDELQNQLSKLALNAKKDYETLRKAAQKFGMEKCEFFYHDTPASIDIKTDGRLKSKKIPEENFDGVWFCATKYKGDLPTHFVYGPHRFRFTIPYICNYLTTGGRNLRLYFKEAHYYGDKPIQYAVLLLSNKEHKDLVEINPGNNSILNIKKSGTDWSAEVCRAFRPEIIPNMYTEIIVDQDVPLDPKFLQHESGTVQAKNPRSAFKWTVGLLQSVNELANN